MRKSLAALAATSLLSAAPIAAATPAAAATSCSAPAAIVSTSVTPRTVVLGTTDNTGIVLTAKIRSNGCRVDRVEMGLYGPNFVDTYDLDRVSTSRGVTTYDLGLRISPGDLPNADAGRWTSFVTVWGESQPESAGPAFKILRAARVSTNAKPEPVKKGRTITVTGKLQRSDWDKGRYRGYGHRRVELQWRTAGGTYAAVKNVSTGKDGSAKARVTATKDGCFRFVFKGSGNTAPAVSPGDCVDVQ